MKPRQSTNRAGAPEDMSAVRRCFDAYGGNVSKWPAEKRASLEAVALSDACAQLRKEAAALDNLMDAATPPLMSVDLKNRIETQYVLPASAGAFSLWSFLRPVPVGALAGFGAFGFAIGIVTGGGQAALTPEAEALAFVEEAAVILEDEEAVPWDVD